MPIKFNNFCAWRIPDVHRLSSLRSILNQGIALLFDVLVEMCCVDSLMRQYRIKTPNAKEFDLNLGQTVERTV